MPMYLDHVEKLPLQHGFLPGASDFPINILAQTNRSPQKMTIVIEKSLASPDFYAFQNVTGNYDSIFV
jgi:hypothetical protein